MDKSCKLSSEDHDIQPHLSIIIPAFNEEKRLPQALDAILAWSEQAQFLVEILVVENGSQDRTTQIAELYVQRFRHIRVLHSKKGKGAAVRTGMLEGNGEYLFICDSDLSMPLEELSKFLSPELSGYDIVIGSREAPSAVRYNEPAYRHLMGRVFNNLVRLTIVPGFSDTQCGFKLFNRKAAQELFAVQTIDGWTFDVEVLYLALKRGYRIGEVPINWYFDPDSRVRPIRDACQMIWDIILIRLRNHQGLYKIPSFVRKRSGERTIS